MTQSPLQPLAEVLDSIPAISDCNVSLSRWPSRRLPFDTTELLVHHLQQHRITTAWAASLDAVLHRDLGGVNLRTFQECQTHGAGILRPVGSVNPMLPDWKEDLRRCHAEYGMQMIRLHPGYHGYELSDPVFAELLHLIAESGLILQIAVRMEDPRTQHPRLRAPDVGLESLVDLLADVPALPVLLANALQVVRGPLLARLAACDQIFMEHSTLEGVGGLEHLIREFPWQRILFGSHSPFFLLSSALLKLQEAELGAEILQAICHRNMERLLSSLVAPRAANRPTPR